MKIIDNKGRLFGKLNIIDLLIILFILIILAVGIKFIFFSVQEQEIKTAQVLIKNQDPWVTGTLSKGDIQYDYETPIARITNINISASQMIVLTDSGEVLLKEHPIKKDIILTIELVAEKQVNVYRFINQDLLIGKTLNFRTDTYTVKGTITNIS